MIDPAPDWQSSIRRSGLLLTPPEGDAGGSILYVEQLRPLRRIDQVVRAQAAPAGYQAGALGEVERLLTGEGEHAALICERGWIGGEPVERCFGVVFGDDFYSLVLGTARGAAHFDDLRAEVRRLVVSDSYLLGARRRRFLHAPPAGWQGFASGPLHATWVPLDYPRNRGLLTVHPALPVPDGQRDYAASFVDLVAERLAGTAGDPDLSSRGLVTAASGLSGTWWELHDRGAAEVRDVVVLEDDRYVYPLVLECARGDRAGNLRAFTEVIDSVEAIPRPARAAVRPSIDAFAMWAE